MDMTKKKSELHTIKMCTYIGLAMLVVGMFFSHWLLLIGGVLLWVAIFMGVSLAEKSGLVSMTPLMKEAMTALCLASILGALNGCIRNGLLSVIIMAAQVIVAVGIAFRAMSLLVDTPHV